MHKLYTHGMHIMYTHSKHMPRDTTASPKPHTHTAKNLHRYVG